MGFGVVGFFAWVLFLVLLSASCFVFRFCCGLFSFRFGLEVTGFGLGGGGFGVVGLVVWFCIFWCWHGGCCQFVWAG